jgi:hypothetical protein
MDGAQWRARASAMRGGWLTLALDGCNVSIHIGSSSSIDIDAVRNRLLKSLTKSQAVLTQLQVLSLSTHHTPLLFTRDARRQNSTATLLATLLQQLCSRYWHHQHLVL